MKVVITGAKGNLGVELVDAFATAGHEVVAFDREGLDVTDAHAVTETFSAIRPGAVINAAAWNDVDGAEDPANRSKVFLLNSDAPGILAHAASKVGAAFVHYSTDYVFDGAMEEGYDETYEPNALSCYGRSKAAGERQALSAEGMVYVCRTSKLFGRAGASSAAKPGFVDLMRRLAATKPELSIVDDEVGAPTWTRDLAQATLRLLTEKFDRGIYHLVNDGPGVTWYGFTGEFWPVFGLTTPRKPVPMSAFPRPAPRPHAALLRNTKFPPLRPRLEALKVFAKGD